jgi:hypothetical protein
MAGPCIGAQIAGRSSHITPGRSIPMIEKTHCPETIHSPMGATMGKPEEDTV